MQSLFVFGGSGTIAKFKANFLWGGFIYLGGLF